MLTKLKNFSDLISKFDINHIEYRGVTEIDPHYDTMEVRLDTITEKFERY